MPLTNAKTGHLPADRNYLEQTRTFIACEDQVFALHATLQITAMENDDDDLTHKIVQHRKDVEENEGQVRAELQAMEAEGRRRKRIS